MLRESIEWHEVAEELPDSDTSVLIFAPELDEPVWIGWFDGTDWYETGAAVITGSVVRWAHLPRGDHAQVPT